MDKDIIQRKEKWERYARAIDTRSASKRATFALTVEHMIEMLGSRRERALLDVGCGFGEIDVLLAQKTNFRIVGCDISGECVRRARGAVKRAGLEEKVKIEEGDVFSLPYSSNHFDVVVSFGYASAATYKGAQSEVSRVLKPGGFLVCDFINYLSLYKIINLPGKWKKLINEEGKHYNDATARGISNYFMRYNLHFISQKLFNTYPSVNFLPSGSLILFDKSIGRIASKILGRVRLVCFQKR